jgi:hypothetical protein
MKRLRISTVIIHWDNSFKSWTEMKNILMGEKRNAARRRENSEWRGGGWVEGRMGEETSMGREEQKTVSGRMKRISYERMEQSRKEREKGGTKGVRSRR